MFIHRNISSHRIRKGTFPFRFFHNFNMLQTSQDTNLSELSIPNLEKYAQLIVSSSNTTSFDVFNPATGKCIGKLPSMTKSDALHYSSIAMNTWQTKWKHTIAKERSKYLMNMVSLMEKYREELAHIISLESGKPLAESYGEITYAISFLELYAEEAKRVTGDIITPPMKGRRLLAIKQPIGPAALITPWNFPAAMITRKLGPALAAGCTAVIKPSEETPFTALALCKIADLAGIPSGVISILTVGRDNVQEVGLSLCHDRNIRKLSFTGSTNVGKWLMRECSTTMVCNSCIQLYYLL